MKVLLSSYYIVPFVSLLLVLPWDFHSSWLIFYFCTSIVTLSVSAGGFIVYFSFNKHLFAFDIHFVQPWIKCSRKATFIGSNFSFSSLLIHMHSHCAWFHPHHILTNFLKVKLLLLASSERQDRRSEVITIIMV